MNAQTQNEIDLSNAETAYAVAVADVRGTLPERIARLVLPLLGEHDLGGVTLRVAIDSKSAQGVSVTLETNFISPLFKSGKKDRTSPFAMRAVLSGEVGSLIALLARSCPDVGAAVSAACYHAQYEQRQAAKAAEAKAANERKAAAKAADETDDETDDTAFNRALADSGLTAQLPA